MLLAHNPGILDELRRPTEANPFRVLVSGCLAGWPCGVDGTDNGLGNALSDFLVLPLVCVFPFCPEQHSLGTPRTVPDIHGGDGFDVLAGRATVQDETGVDLTRAMIDGGRAMLGFAQEHKVEIAILTDASAACGSQVISDGCRLVPIRRHQKGVGVATALLLQAGIHVVSQRDFQTLARIRKHIDPDFLLPSNVRDHHEHPWTLEYLPGLHPRA